jgi:uncharacterized protein (TIGR02391 family)
MTIYKFKSEDLLHPRIDKHCTELFSNKHYPQAANEAMKQVEIALKEKLGDLKINIRKPYGADLAKSLFGEGKGIKLTVPFSGDLQDSAKTLFAGAFYYYRNYAAHKGEGIDEKISLRIMILASELIDLTGASTISFAEIGGVKGMIETALFNNEQEIHDILVYMDGYIMPDLMINGLMEDLALKGFSNEQYEALFDIGLLEYHEEPYKPNKQEIMEGDYPDTLGRYELTNLGRNLLKELKNRTSNKSL